MVNLTYLALGPKEFKPHWQNELIIAYSQDLAAELAFLREELIKVLNSKTYTKDERAVIDSFISLITSHGGPPGYDYDFLSRMRKR